MKRWDDVDAIIGGVFGPINRPEVVIVGRYRDGELVVFGHSTELTAAQSRQFAAVLTPAGQDHPWPDELHSRWSTSTRPLTKVEPLVVFEIAADTATQAGRPRHTVRFIRVRPDLDPADVPDMPNGQA